jgi:DNA polymerase-3 subunit alpha
MFVSLHNHTQYSILSALSTPKDLFNKAKELNQPAIAVTDHGSFAGLWESYKVSKETGVKLIAGVEIYFQHELGSSEKFKHLILLAKNAVGYKNMLTLNKLAYDQGFTVSKTKKVYPIVTWDLLEKYSEGVICLTACGSGLISQAIMKKDNTAETYLLKLIDIFGRDNLGLEIQPNNHTQNGNYLRDEVNQNFINRQLINLGKKHNVRVVATCNSHYVNKSNHKTHDVLLAIGSHQPVYSNFRLKYSVPDFYLKSYDEVKSFFARNYTEEVAEEFCSNSLYFANLCEDPAWIDPKYSNPSGKELPEFPVKDEPDYQEFLTWKNSQTPDLQKLEDDKLFLRFHCEQELVKLNLSEDKLPTYKARLQEEYDVLEYHGFSSYMLIVADFLNWARKQNISVGPGRGSVGGSLVGYLLDIHQADPIKYHLIFARFHNKEKTSYPDVDVDLCTTRRGDVINYVKNKYGTDNVANVSNINTITPKVYARDVSRACELGGSKEAAVKLGNDLADLFHAEDKFTNKDIFEKNAIFKEYAKRYHDLTDHIDIGGKYRAWSTHAAGVIIAKRSLVGLVPLRRDKDGVLALEYDKDKAEENGLVKMDFLGLSTLDLVDQVKQLIKEAGKEVPNIDFEKPDPKAYELLTSGETFGVFQLGTSSGTMELCKKIHPNVIEDISHINALARPSAKDIREKFTQTRDGKLDVVMLHQALERAFGATYGFGLYEESLMYLAQDVAGWSLHGADRLRKLTKEKGKNPKKAAAWRLEFIRDAVANNIDEKIATDIWDEVIEKFAGYGFNKCLGGDTDIATYTKEGRFLKLLNIKDFKGGEFVRSRDERQQKDIFVEVQKLHKNGDKEMVEITLDSGEKIQCTMDHKFRTKCGQMLSLQQIIKKGLSIVVKSADAKNI